MRIASIAEQAPVAFFVARATVAGRHGMDRTGGIPFSSLLPIGIEEYLRMYDSKKAEIEARRILFERQAELRSPVLQKVANDYLEALSDFVTTFNEGPGSDPRLMGLDTTGELNRIEEYAAWAEDELRRVRGILAQNY